MPFNSTLFINIIAATWVAGGFIHMINVFIAKTDKDKIVSLLMAILMFVVIGVCLVL